MILVDTSVWIGHFRSADARLSSLLEERRVLMHPFVLGELACGWLPGKRTEVLAGLGELPEAPMAANPEVLELIELRGLANTGVGWIDAHLLASALIGSVPLWSVDRGLVRAARRLEVAAT
jgi:predicted nucleic acid-binding protein